MKRTDDDYMCISPDITFIHKHPLPVVVNTFFTKYPDPKRPEVLSAVIKEEKIDPSTGCIHREREITIQNKAPWIFRKILRSDTLLFIESSDYCPQQKRMTLTSSNTSFANIIHTRETSTFTEYSDNPQWTQFVQQGGVRASTYFGPLRSKIENVCCGTFLKMGQEACTQLERIISERAAAMGTPHYS